MDNSSRFFANKECEFYPCHESEEDINCLFCYCPLYFGDCPGDYRMTEKNGRMVKSCKQCVFPHKAENYDLLMSILRSKI
ncbi:MAG: cysteine-rich small domain-containing protein [Lachnospiraceae bacterium]|nr:cysteine-rich small domain-containing protein [Lachnospiraceae bacterium]